MSTLGYLALILSPSIAYVLWGRWYGPKESRAHDTQSAPDFSGRGVDAAESATGFSRAA